MLLHQIELKKMTGSVSMRRYRIIFSLVFIMLMSACGSSLSATPTLVTPRDTATARPTIVPIDATLLKAFNSDTYAVDVQANSSMFSSWALKVTGDQIVGTSHWDCCPAVRVDSLKGHIEGDQVIIERDCSGQGFDGECHQAYIGKLNGNTITGPAQGTGLPPTSTWTLHLNVAVELVPTPTPMVIDEAWDFSNQGMIAYFRCCDSVHVIMLDGDIQTQQLFKFAALGNFSWSPEGDALVYSASPDANADLFSYSITDAKPTNITNSATLFEVDPDWSPNGEKMVFSRSVDGKTNWDIYTMNADGTQITKLTKCFGAGCHTPHWSPSGEAIVYVYNHHIYTMKADGSEQTELASGYDYNFWPRWSPDGKRMAFITSNDEYSNRSLYVMTLNTPGVEVQDLTGGNYNVGKFSWSPNGKLIIFDTLPLKTNDNTTDSLLWMVNVQLGQVIPFLSQEGKFSAPEWSPLHTTKPTPEPIVAPDCTSGWSRLKAGGGASVMGAQVRVRSSPQVGDNQLGDLTPGDYVELLSGPVCADGLVFWQVGKTPFSDSAWVAEGDGTYYWLEPFKQ